jgi:homeobox protein cut-like
MASTAVAAAAWQTASFSDVVAQMQQTVNSHKNLREQSLKGRRTLAETTKQFKRSVKIAESAATSLAGNLCDASAATASCTAMEALSKECRVTVKSYQEEIDNLTRRCKNAESGYAAVCVVLQELPDPVVVFQQYQKVIDDQKQHMDQLLETVNKVNQELEEAETKKNEYRNQAAASSSTGSGDSIHSNSDHGGNLMSNDEREELIALRKEVAEYEVEFRSLKNQDITIRKLEDKIIELQTVGAESIEQSILQARQELALKEGRRAAEALEREAALEAKVQTLQLQIRSERAGREATQNDMLQSDEGQSRREAAWEAQRQILVDDNERVREALQTALREREQLQMKLAVLESPKLPNSPPSGTGVQDLLLERNAYEAEVRS